jgi:RimJ/RimL family protein N-acetyltransferase
VNALEATTIISPRLALVRLQTEDADDLARVLCDESLYEFIGGCPLAVAELRDRYTKLAADSADPDESWLNWIVRRRIDSEPIGTVQTTLATHGGRRTAHVAWIIGVDYQNQGFASEAARALVEWLRQHGVDNIVAHIHPDHRASARVASRAGLQPTGEYDDGEQVWRAPEDR